MSDYITALLDVSVWHTIFITSFFFGLFFLLFVVFTSFDHHGADKDFLHDHDLGADHDISMDHGLDTNHDLGHFDPGDHEVLVESHELHIETVGETDGDHIFASESGDISIIQDAKHVEKSNYTLGNIAVFLFMFGQVGWFFSNELTDQILAIAIGVGFIMMKIFSWILSNYAKTVIVPVFVISRGDIGTVVSDVTYEKSGIVQVTKKDGMIVTIMARGAFPHDSFIRGEKGYIWDHEGSFYTLTRGLQSQPDLNSEQKPKKKAFP